MMFFGLNTFGGAVAGLVLASGTAGCGATATGQNEVTRLFTGQAVAQASGSAYCRRQANNKPKTLTATAAASGAAVAFYNPLPVSILAQAMANTAKAQAEFSAYGAATGYANVLGKAVRRIKVYPLRAAAYAQGEAEAQQWQMADPAPAYARASGFGTTYHVGYALGTGAAGLSGSARKQTGGAGLASADCLCTTVYDALQEKGAAGEAWAYATVLGDPGVTHNGVRYFEGWSEGQATASGQLTHVGITQGQTARCYAYAEGHPNFVLGGKGRGNAKATGYGNGLGMATAVTAESANTAAQASGYALILLMGKGNGQGKATGYGAALVKNTKANPATAQARATLVQSQDSKRLKSAYGLGQAKATMQTLHIQRGVKLQPGVAQALTQSGEVLFNVYPCPALADAQASLSGVRVQYGAGEALALATGQGANSVNDLVRAPAERTVVEPYLDRRVLVAAEPRTVLV